MRISQTPTLTDAFSSCIVLSIDQKTTPPSLQNKCYFAYSLLSSIPFLIPVTLSWNEFSAYWNKVGILTRTLPLILIFRSICKIAKNDYQFRNNCPFVREEQLISHWMVFYENWCLNIFENLPNKLKFFFNMTRITGTLHKNQCTLIITPCCVLFRVKMCQKISVEKIKTRIFYNFFRK
jgi:hypothetical protein